MTYLSPADAMKALWQWEFLDPGPEPDVTIVIPVHGNIAMTMRCLWSIHQAQHLNSARVEVLVVDDASPDHTVATLTQLRRLEMVTLDRNVGYLRATNAGIAAARGRHVHLLNNDTLVQGRWLDPLLETLVRRNALAVGSKLVYADGIVQEAGGIIFSDGTGWNYGRRRDPDHPSVSYERRVDYCSAASLLVDGDFLRARGGFDERYVPAYYEDTDLCFAAREAGGEVWYQPESVVVHLEGQSHGTDETSGIKAHQVINRERFVERHREALAAQQSGSREASEWARERVRGRVVVVDNEIPTPDRDSGSVRQSALMAAMVEGGWGVTFIPVNGWRRAPYVHRLERLGVEVLGSSDTWWPHLEEIAPTVTHVWLSRPNVTAEFLDRFREALPNAQIIYDTVDLHFLREGRRAELTGDPAFVAKAKRMRDIELGSMSRVDHVVVVSPVEKAVLLEQEGVDSVVIPNVHPTLDVDCLPEGREGLLFVGGFRHPPNVDAVVWMAREVLPLVRAQRPETELVVVGSHAPPEIMDLADVPGVRLLGWVPDTAPYYARARVAVAPLRYGAGLKGKVGEAMSHGTPMVLTSVACEGMDLVSGQHAIVADDAATFAAGVLDLLDDDQVWTQMAQSARGLIHDSYSPEVVGGLVLGLLGDSPAQLVSELPASSSAASLVRMRLENVRMAGQLEAAREAAVELTRQAEVLRRELVVVETEPATFLVTSGSAVEAFERDQMAAVLARALDEAAEGRFITQGRAHRFATRFSSFLRRVLHRPAPGRGGTDSDYLVTLAGSGIVDADWYRATYPDIVAAGRDPFEHYTTQGWRERRAPGPLFDPEWYLASYPEVGAAGIDPAMHYAVWGWREGKRPSMWFDAEAYARRHALSEAGVSPLTHYAAALRQRALAAGRSRDVDFTAEPVALALPAGTSDEPRSSTPVEVVREARQRVSSGRHAVLHIGIEGTGTTYLQEDLAANRELLVAAGWAYPDFLVEPNHHALAAYAIEPTRVSDFHAWNGVTADNVGQKRREFEGLFRAETSAADRWVFSNEHLSTWATTSDIERLDDLFDQAGLELTVVMYVRRQDCLIPSSYSTAVKWGWPKPFELEHYLSLRERYDFNELFTRWNSVLEGRVQVRPYLEHQVSPWLAEDFCGAVLGIDEEHLSHWQHPQRRANTSLSLDTLELLRRTNAALEGGPIHPGERLRLVAGLSAMPSDSPAFRLTEEQAATAMAAYRTVNERLCEQAPTPGLADLLLR